MHIWNWRIVLVIAGFFICFVTDGIFYSFGVLLSELLLEYDEGDSRTAWVGSLSRGHIQLIGLVVGPLTKLFGCRIIAMFGSVLTAFALLISSFAVNLLYLDFSYGVLGGCAAGFCIHPAVIATTVSFREHRGLAVGLVTAGTGTGNFVLSAVSYWLTKTYGWRGCLIISSGMMLSVLFFAIFLLPVNPFPCCFELSPVPSKGDTSERPAREELVDDEDAKGPGCWDFCRSIFNFQILTEIRFVFVCVGGAIVSLGLFVPSMFIIRYASTSNIAAEYGAYLLSIMGISNTVSRVVSGFITDQTWGNIFVVYIGAMFLAGLSCIVASFYDSFVAFAIFASVFGICMGTVLSLRSTIVFEVMGLEYFHYAFGMYLLFTGIAAFTGPPLFGFVYEQSASFPLTFMMAGIIILVGMFFWCAIPIAGLLKNCCGTPNHTTDSTE